MLLLPRAFVWRNLLILFGSAVLLQWTRSVAVLWFEQSAVLPASTASDVPFVCCCSNYYWIVAVVKCLWLTLNKLCFVSGLCLKKFTNFARQCCLYFCSGLAPTVAVLWFEQSATLTTSDFPFVCCCCSYCYWIVAVVNSFGWLSINYVLPRAFVWRNLLISLGSAACTSAVGSLQQWLYFGSNKVMHWLH